MLNWIVSNESDKIDIFWTKKKQACHFWKGEKAANSAVLNETVAN